MSNCDNQPPYLQGKQPSFGTPNPRHLHPLVRVNGVVQDMPQGFLIPRCFLDIPGTNPDAHIAWDHIDNVPCVLSSLGALNPPAGDFSFPVFTDVCAASVAPITVFGMTFVNALDAAAAKLLLELDKADVGLDQVDNTTDLNKPISNATQIALNGKLSDVSNGTGTGVTFVTSPTSTTRSIAQLKAVGSDVVITQGAAGAANTVGLNGTTLKYWEEVSSAHPLSPSDTELLVWRPKAGIGTFDVTKTVEVISVKQGFTLRNPAETGGSFPVNFTSGLDLQVKGATGTNDTYPRGGYTFGEGNKTFGANGVAIGIQNVAGGVVDTYGVSLGRNNTATAYFGQKAVSVGDSCSAAGGVAFGRSASALLGVALGQELANNGQLISVLLGWQIIQNGETNIQVGMGLTAGVLTGQCVSIGQNITQTAPNTIVIAAPKGSNNPTDQGIKGLQQVGNNVQIPLNLSITGLTDWTNAAWRDVAGSIVSSTYSTLGIEKYSASFACALTQDIVAGGTQVPVRVGIIKVEAWRYVNGTMVPTLHILEGGDVNFLTYFDFQLVNSGGGMKLQWKFASDPSGGSPNAGQVDINGSIQVTTSANF